VIRILFVLCARTANSAELLHLKLKFANKEKSTSKKNTAGLMNIKNPKEWFSVEPWPEKKRAVFRAIKEL